MAKTQVTPIIGLPQFNGWSQVATNSPRSLICSLAVHGANAGNIGRDIVAAIEQAKPATAADFHTFLQSVVTEVSEAGGQLSVASLLLANQQTVLATYHGSILLKRNGKVGIILSSADNLKILEGQFVPEDSLVLTTAQGSSYLGEIQQKIHQGFDLDTIITSLVPAIHAAADSSLTSLGFVTLGEFEPEPEPEPEASGLVLPELEITLETIEETKEAIQEEATRRASSIPDSPAEPLPLLDTQIPLATTTEASVAEKQVSDAAKAKPLVQISWTKSSKAETLPQLKPLFSALKQKSVGIAAKLGSSLARVWQHAQWSRWHPRIVWAKLANRDVYVTRRSRQKLIKILVVVGVTIGLVMIGLLVWRRWQTQQVQAAEAAVAPLLLEFDQARDQVANDPVGARQRMEHVLQQIEVLSHDFRQQPAGLRFIEQRLVETQTTYDELSGREELSSLPIFFDLSTLASDWVANQLAAEGSRIAIMDAGKQQVTLLDILTKQTQTLPAMEKQPTDITINENLITVLGQGISQADLTAESAEFTEVVAEGDSNRDGTLLGSFSSYLYVVNPAKRNIFRYSASEDGYSDPIGWLRPGQQFNYEVLHSLSIDGDVWFGTTDGQILKLATGQVEPFEVKGLPEPFTSSLIVYTQENLQYLYVLEPASRRLVVLQKTGEFIRQIKSGSLAAVTDVVVNEEAQKALAVSGSLIFEITL